MNSTNKVLLRALMLAAFVYAAFQKLEWLSIVVLVFVFLSFAHRASPLRRLFNVFISVLSSTKMAKFKGFELDVIDEKSPDLTQTLSQAPPWTRVVASSLNSQQIGLLMAIGKRGGYQFPHGLIDSMRELRERG
jgi:hypothetical protein